MSIDTIESVIHAAHEPGNGTRYDLLLVKGERNYVFAWLNAPSHGRVMYINPGAVVHWTYMAEKFAYDNKADLRPLLEWLAARGVGVYLLPNDED